MPLLLTYLEEQADISPTTASFTNTQQSASGTFLLEGPTAVGLTASIVDLLGYTDTRTTDGRIRRVLPARHPAYRWMFADSCTHQGVGGAFNMVTPDAGGGSPMIPTYPLYVKYHVRVNFSGRPYNSWQDKDISITADTYYEKTDTGAPAAGVSFSYATEWHRFTTWELIPTNQFITAQQGQMVFRVSGVGGAAQPDGITFQDAPKLYLPDSLLRVRWFEVPYRYLTSSNSYLRKFIGHVNQSAFSDGPVEGGGTQQYPAGSLLYLGANVARIYTQAIPDEGLLGFNFGNSFQRGRLCDLELNFLYTARTNGAASGNQLVVANRNRITAGHNLLPWLTTRKFYYATTYDPASPADQTKWFPSYNSFRFEMLFTDPDAATSPLVDP